MQFRIILAASLLALLSACGEGSAPPPKRVVSAPPPPVRKPATTAPLVQPPVRRPPPVSAHMLPGLEGVIGATTGDLIRQFGKPRLDVYEGEARKLQFLGTACVLDIYLYPSAAGREPQASHTEARRASDGRDVDRALCVASLRKR